MTKQFYLLFLLIFSNNLFANTYTVDSIPNIYKQSHVVYVANPDHIITAEHESKINAMLAELERNTTIEVAVVAVQSIGQQDTREFANQLFSHWKIGKAASDNGLLMLLVIDQREIVFETGYGLEGILPDITCKRLQRDYMVPALGRNEFSLGMIQGVRATNKYLSSEEFRDEFRAEETSSGIQINWPFFIGVTLVSFLLVVILPRIWGKNDAKSLLIRTNYFAMVISFLIFIILPSFVAFMLIFFFYRKWLIRKTILCPKCQANHFKSLPKAQHADYLTDKQLFEIKIKAVKYPIYECLDCHHVFKLTQIGSKYTLCSQCDTIAVHIKSTKILQPATYISAGQKLEELVCEYCGATKLRKRAIPRRTRSSGSSSSFGGGRSGGGGSSGSRGGGSSGGGGSRSSF